MATQPFGGGGFGDALEENRQLGFESHLNSFLSRGRQASQGGRQSGGAGRSRQRALRNQFSFHPSRLPWEAGGSGEVRGVSELPFRGRAQQPLGAV